MNDRLCLSDDERASDCPDDRTMLASAKYAVALYADRTTRQWVVRDPEGCFWQLPADDGAWQHRQPFHLTEDTDLEAVPGHYQYMLNLPF